MGALATQSSRREFSEHDHVPCIGAVRGPETASSRPAPTKVTVHDAHASKRNLPIELLDPRATLITETHKQLGMMHGVDGGVDVVASR